MRKQDKFIVGMWLFIAFMWGLNIKSLHNILVTHNTPLFWELPTPERKEVVLTGYYPEPFRAFSVYCCGLKKGMNKLNPANAIASPSSKLPSNPMKYNGMDIIAPTMLTINSLVLVGSLT